METSSGARRWIELATTRWFGVVVVALCLVPAGVIAIVVGVTTLSLEDVDTFVGACLKVAIALAGAAWALNRLFITRADAPQLRVEGFTERVDVDAFRSDRIDESMLLCHVEATNTGKTLIRGYKWHLETHVLRPGLEDRLLVRSPLHLMPSIEPGSWAAIDAPVQCPSDIAVVRLVVVVLTQSNQPAWTWHRSFNVAATDSNAGG